MRWCRHCRHFNLGEPLRCRYCRVGLIGRLCPRNHLNPADPDLAFCGDCGQPLEEQSGAGRAWPTWRTIRAAVVALGVLAAAVALNGPARALIECIRLYGDVLLGLLIALVVMGIGFYVMLPPFLRRWFLIVLRAPFRMKRLLLRTRSKGSPKRSSPH